MERVSSPAESDLTPRVIGGMRAALSRQDPVLSFPAPGEAGDHRLGTGELSVRRERERCGAEVNLRSLLHQALLSETRRDDRSEDDLYDVCGQRKINEQFIFLCRYRLTVIS